MSKIFPVLATAFLAVPISAFSEDAPDGDPAASYQTAYLSPVQTVCGNAFKPEKSLIRQASFPYPKIGDPTAEKQYREMVKGVGWDLSGLNGLFSSEPPAGTTKIESVIPYGAAKTVSAASEAYKERVNGLFACAQINFKIRVHDRLLDTVRGEKADNGNMVRKIGEQTRLLRKESEKRRCVDVSDSRSADNIYLKKLLLDNAFYQYCDYRHYLQYLKTNLSTRLTGFYGAEKNRTDEKVSNPDAVDPAISSEKALDGILSSMGKIDTEISHARDVFPQAMAAYSEFERTYASHVVMLMITEDYRLLRESLKKIMNPLGQVIYKASNAQSPHSLQ